MNGRSIPDEKSPITIERLNLLCKNVKQKQPGANAAFTRALNIFGQQRSTDEHTFTCVPDERWKSGAIAVAAHWKLPKRALIVLFERTDISPTDEIADVCKWKFRKLHLKLDDGKFIMDSISQPEQRMYAKKGFWCILGETLDKNLTWPMDGGVSISKTPALYENLKVIYQTYVDGMEKYPKAEVFEEAAKNKTFIRKDAGYEQFLLTKYPTEQWKLFCDTHIKQKKSTTKHTIRPLEEVLAASMEDSVTEEEIVQAPKKRGRKPGSGKQKKSKVRKTKHTEEEEEEEGILVHNDLDSVDQAKELAAGVYFPKPNDPSCEEFPIENICDNEDLQHTISTPTNYNHLRIDTSCDTLPLMTLGPTPVTPRPTPVTFNQHVESYDGINVTLFYDPNTDIPEVRN